MSLVTPTTQETSDGIVAELEAKLSQDIPLLPKAFTRVLAKALAGALVLLYKYAGFILQQQFIRYASAKETIVNGQRLTPLVELGRENGTGDPFPAVRAELNITVTVTQQTGTLPAGSQVLYPASGVLYTTKADVALDAATVQAVIRAQSGPDNSDGAGSIGNLEPGDEVEFANPLPNISRLATVLSVAVTGTDAESTDDYRERVLEREQARPQGGAYADYRFWASSVAGIVGVFPYRSDTPGEVDVFVEATEDSSGSADGIPTGAQLLAVANAIEYDDEGLASRRPVTAAVNVLPITRRAFNLTVNGLDAEDEAAAEEAIETAVDEYLRSRKPFIAGLSVLPREDRITAGALSGVVDDAVSALGGTVTGISVDDVDGAVVAYTLAAGELAKLGTATFV